MAVLTCEGLSKRFGDRVAVDGVGFSVDAGETYGLLGPNGAGKTTTISMVVGLLASDDGSVTIAGERVSTVDTAARSHVGLVPQEVALYPDLTGRENLRFFGRLQRLGGADLAARIDRVLEVVGLGDRADDRVGEYSGGMQRRCNIAAGLLHGPDLLVLDEPTVGVDPQSRAAILDSIDDLGDSGLAVLYTTHYMEEAERLCDRVGIIDGGRLVAEGTRSSLLRSVGHQDRVRITVDGDTSRYARWCRDLPWTSVADVDGDTVVAAVDEGSRRLPLLLAGAVEEGVTVTAVEVVRPDLEDVFLSLTGRALRDP